jgi:hypothetical protein
VHPQRALGGREGEHVHVLGGATALVGEEEGGTTDHDQPILQTAVEQSVTQRFERLMHPAQIKHGGIIYSTF